MSGRGQPRQLPRRPRSSEAWMTGPTTGTVRQAGVPASDYYGETERSFAGSSPVFGPGVDLRGDWKGVCDRTAAAKEFWAMWSRFEIRNGLLGVRWESDGRGAPQFRVLLPAANRREAFDRLYASTTGRPPRTEDGGKAPGTVSLAWTEERRGALCGPV